MYSNTVIYILIVVAKNNDILQMYNKKYNIKNNIFSFRKLYYI